MSDYEAMLKARRKWARELGESNQPWPGEVAMAGFHRAYFDALADVANAAITSTPPEALPITENDKRWRILEHGCQWVSWTPIGGETHSFDPRDVEHLKRMRAWADETIEKHLTILRDGISARSPRGKQT